MIPRLRKRPTRPVSGRGAQESIRTPALGDAGGVIAELMEMGARVIDGAHNLQINKGTFPDGETYTPEPRNREVSRTLVKFLDEWLSLIHI